MISFRFLATEKYERRSLAFCRLKGCPGALGYLSPFFIFTLRELVDLVDLSDISDDTDESELVDDDGRFNSDIFVR
jgi:hypothetical protein